MPSFDAAGLAGRLGCHPIEAARSLAELTDQAVANQLGLSMRTVQRRVRALMDLVAAETGRPGSSRGKPPIEIL